ncbi:uncharacterized protein LOC143240105 isoform X2 [Tachypleus tridentatus]|uniref:uncharacterized protein LOC143240105 isoform X2 n=1 Tax=Tachypleus tridentatus TaxID=6853 RepID=UPI003FD151DA
MRRIMHGGTNLWLASVVKPRAKEEAILIRTTTCVSQIREPYSLGITVGNLELRMKLPTKGKAAKRTHLHKIRTNDKRKDGQQHLLSKFMCVLITFSTQDASP